MTARPAQPHRRAFLRTAAGAAASGFAGLAGLAAPAARALTASAPASTPPAAPHLPFGRVEPALPAPPIALAQAQGGGSSLPALLRGQATAVQLMFTGCSAVCPIQGALFADVARRLPGTRTRLLSLSIDPLGDDPAALRGWLARFAAPALWSAAAPAPKDLDRMLDYLRGRALGADRHSTQIYLFDARARLVYRTPELPPAAHVVTLLGEVARLG